MRLQTPVPQLPDLLPCQESEQQFHAENTSVIVSIWIGRRGNQCCISAIIIWNRPSIGHSDSPREAGTTGQILMRKVGDHSGNLLSEYFADIDRIKATIDPFEPASGRLSTAELWENCE